MIDEGFKYVKFDAPLSIHVWFYLVMDSNRLYFSTEHLFYSSAGFKCKYVYVQVEFILLTV